MPRRQRRPRALTCSHISASPLFSVNAFMSRFRPVRMVVIVIGVSSIMARRWTRAALRRAKAHGGAHDAGKLIIGIQAQTRKCLRALKFMGVARAGGMREQDTLIMADASDR